MDAETAFCVIEKNDPLQLNLTLSENPSAINIRHPATKVTLLHHACQVPGISPEITSLLLYFKADINAQDSKGLSPLHYACVRGNWNICRVLVNDERVNPSVKANDNVTAFACAVDYPFDKIKLNDIPMYKEVLLKLSIDIQNIKCIDTSKNSTLHFAARKNNKIAAIRILENGVPINILNKYVILFFLFFIQYLNYSFSSIFY